MLKKYFSLLLFLPLFFISQKSFSQGIWTWMDGSATANLSPSYGSQGVPAPNNHPGALYAPYCWTDLQGKFWLYGGTPSYGDLWRFDPATLMWTWIHGPGTMNPAPVYGTQGIPSPTNNPGARIFSGTTWTDASGDLWLFGGLTYLNGYIMSDMWRYTIATNQWTWMSGSAIPNVPAVYGTLGVPNSANQPGSRYEINNSWLDLNGKLWLYGGQHRDSALGYVPCADVWQFDPLINQWAWQSGPQIPSTSTLSYGLQGVFSATNSPGERAPYAMEIDNDGKFWLFGGLSSYYRGDLWEYDPAIKQWAWINGSTAGSAPGLFGNTCESDSTFYPNSRTENRAFWKDAYDNFWMFGGACPASGPSQAYGDMWVYLKHCKKWARMSDSSYLNYPVHFGTIGVPALSNHPGARQGVAHWKDLQNNFWIYSGATFPSNIKYNDMWKYTPDLSCVSPDCIVVPPDAGFTSSNLKVCPGVCVDYFNQSLNSVSYEWFFAGGNPAVSTSENPLEICYYTSGNYDVMLVAHNNGLTDTLLMPGYITVVPEPDPIITLSNDTLFCTNVLANSTYQWYADGSVIAGSTNDFYVADTNAIYSVQVTSIDGCVGTDVLETITIGMNEISDSDFSEYIISPNPADESVTISLGNQAHEAEIKLYNTLGQLIYQNMILRENKIDLKNLSAGIFYITVQSPINFQAKKLVVTHH